MSPPRVAAVVLDYNGREITLESLASLARTTYPACDLVLVDNGSTDGSWEAVGEAFPQATRVRSEENLGPAGGLNLGVRHVLEAGHDYALLLNNDIEADPEMVSELVAAAEADPRVGCAGPKIYYYWERDRLWSAGGIIRFKESVTRERGMGRIDRGQYDRREEVDFVNGCALLVKRRVLEEVGPFDPVYRFAVEDADWCMRMKRRGYRCLYVPTAVLWHMVARSTGVYSPGKTFHTGRSSAIFVRRYARLREWLTYLAFMAAALPAAFLRELPRGNARAAIAKGRGAWEGLRLPMPDPPTLEDLPRPTVTAPPDAASAGAANSRRKR